MDAMKKRYLLPMAAALLFGAGEAAMAHVNYIDLSDPVASPGGTNGSSFSNFGWFDGTTTTLGDSHDLAGGDFFKFTLTQASRVTITFSDDAALGALNPAFSVYAGLLPDEAHDDAGFDPLNPRAPAVPFAKSASPVDDDTTADTFGRVSPFRDTANIEFIGQFDALHSWSMANESDDWSVIDYVTHVGPQGANSVSLTDYLLPAGVYSIAAAGGTNCHVGGGVCLTNLAGTLQFTAAPVPEPSQAWMLAGGLALLGAAAGRKRQRGKRIVAGQP
jgi:hypothetical protein